MLPYLAALLGGTVAFRLLCPRWPLLVCLAAGACVGSAALGLLCLLLACVFGLSIAVIGVTSALFMGLPIALYLRRRPQALRRRVTAELGYFLAAAVAFTSYFRALFFVQADGYYIGAKDAWADLPYHLAILEGFVQGDNFPPRDPLLSEARLAYPYLIDFIAALGVRSGLTLTGAILVQNIILALSLGVLLHFFTWRATRSRLAAALAPVLLFLNGGLGFVLVAHDRSPLRQLPHDYTEVDNLLHWGNPLVYWFSSMRGMLLGAPLFVLVLLLFWEALRGHPNRARKRLILAGAVCGCLPLAHAHTFATLVLLAPLVVLLRRGNGRVWGGFFALALLLALPQLRYATAGAQVHATTFFGWSLGWMKSEQGVVEYWLWNTGVFIPLLLIGLITPVPRLISPALKRFWCPFALCFLVPNIIKLAPWEWDSIKVLYLWCLCSCPIVALVVARIARQGLIGRTVAAVLVFLLCASGGLDVWRVVSGQVKSRIYDPEQLAFAELVAKITPPQAVILSAPAHNPPHQLAGRRTFLGYTGFLWTHGLDYIDREKELQTIYAGGPEAAALVKRHGLRWAVVGPMERENLRYHHKTLNEAWFRQFPSWEVPSAESPERSYSLYLLDGVR